jgi:hypothetical protein
MNACCGSRSTRPAGLFSFGLLDGPQVRLLRPHLREVPAGFGLSRLATAFTLIQVSYTYPMRYRDCLSRLYTDL